MHYHLLLVLSLINNDLKHGIPAFAASTEGKENGLRMD
jgi:hypothetical protein